ncbi:UNVERIFIED_CONTAM: hypothetical protein HDU68_001449, partial [Siphonaria sp. JEL0065]
MAVCAPENKDFESSKGVFPPRALIPCSIFRPERYIRSEEALEKYRDHRSQRKISDANTAATSGIPSVTANASTSGSASDQAVGRPESIPGPDLRTAFTLPNEAPFDDSNASKN